MKKLFSLAVLPLSLCFLSVNVSASTPPLKLTGQFAVKGKVEADAKPTCQIDLEGFKNMIVLDTVKVSDLETANSAIDKGSKDVILKVKGCKKDKVEFVFEEAFPNSLNTQNGTLKNTIRNGGAKVEVAIFNTDNNQKINLGSSTAQNVSPIQFTGTSDKGSLPLKVKYYAIDNPTAGNFTSGIKFKAKYK